MFENGGEQETWLSSADWMQRNFFRRVEISFPVVEPALAKQVVEALDTMWKDNVRARAS